MRMCSKCKQSKVEEDFYGRNTGLQYHCKQCQKIVIRDHYQKNKAYYTLKNKEKRKRRSVLYEELKNAPCADCDKSYPHYVMDFDHVGKNKSMAVSLAKHKALSVLLGEASKCEIVCANCHRERTHKRRMGIL